MERFRVTKKPEAAEESFDEGPPPAPAPPPKSLFGGLFRKKGGRAAGAVDGEMEEVFPTEEELALIDDRLAWRKEESARRQEAFDTGVDFVPREMPEQLQDDEYRTRKAEEEEDRRHEHEREEKRRQNEFGDQYVPTPFRPEEGVVEGEDDDAYAAPPPPAPPASEEDGGLAELFGQQAYGGGQLSMHSSFAAGKQAPARTYDPAADVYGAPVGYANPAVQEVKKYGWAGIFDRHPNGPPPPPNPFAGPIVMPQMYAPGPVQSRAHEKGIPYDAMQRLNEGRGLATLALNNQESAPVLAGRGKREEANAAYRAADAGYERALQLLMPARKMLEDGPDASRVVRAREKDKLEKLIAQILDRWEEVKPYLIPDVPTTAAQDPRDAEDSYSDPLLERLTHSFARMGPGAGGAASVPQGPPPSLYTANGELNLDALPSVPKEGAPLEGWEVPKSGGPKKCYVCATPTSTKPAEVVTPCDHYLCVSCSESVFGLFNACPQCNASCRKDQLKAIA